MVQNCEVCGCTVVNMGRHILTAKHVKLASDSSTAQSSNVNEEGPNTISESDYQPVLKIKEAEESESEDDDSDENASLVAQPGDFLQELETNVWAASQTKAQEVKKEEWLGGPAQPKKNKMTKAKEVEFKLPKAPKEKRADYDKEIFSEKGSEILGNEKISLCQKIKAYKREYPVLKSFKVKVGSTAEELKQYIKEIETIVSSGGGDQFLTEGLLFVIGTGEKMALMVRQDIRGLADELRKNLEFQKIMRLLNLKYGNFSSIPPELQLLFVVGSVAYGVRMANMQRTQQMPQAI